MSYSNIGAYNLYFGISLAVPSDAFSSLLGSLAASQTLVNLLLTQGYLDVEAFLSDQFDPNTVLKLPGYSAAQEL